MLDHAVHVDQAEVSRVSTNDFIGQVPDLEQPVVVDRDRDQVQVFSVPLQRGKVGLHDPLDANVCDRGLREPTTAHPLIILEHDEELLRG